MRHDVHQVEPSPLGRAPCTPGRRPVLAQILSWTSRVWALLVLRARELAGEGLSFPALPVLTGLCALAALAALLPAGVTRALIFWVASGAFLVAVFFHQFGCVEWIAAGLILSFVAFSLLGALAWPVGLPPHLAVLAVMLVALAREWRKPPRRLTLHAGAVDVAAVCVTVLVSFPIVVIARRNGLQPNGSFVARHFFAYDSYFFYSLAEAFVNGHHVPVEVPFVAGSQNAYRTWLQAGFGGLRLMVGTPSPLAGIVLIPAYLLATQGLAVWSFVRCSGSKPSVGTATLAAALAVALFVLRPDLAIYPTTQGIALGALYLVGWLWRGPLSSIAESSLAMGASLVVLMGHGLSGVVAVAFVGSRSIQRLLARETRLSGMVFLGLSIALGVAVLLVNRMPHAGLSHALSWPLTAQGLRAFFASWPLLAIITAGAALAWRTGGLAPIALLALGLLFRVAAHHRIDLEEVGFLEVNADRFVFFASVTLALALVGAHRRRLAFVVVLVLATFFGWGNEAASNWLATARMATSDGFRIEPGELKLFEEIRRRTPADARIISTVHLNALPAFTGRVQSPVGTNLGALGMIKPEAYSSRVKDRARFADASPAEKIAIMERGGYSHALLVAKVPITAIGDWVRSRFPVGSVQVLYADGSSVLLARQRGGPGGGW